MTAKLLINNLLAHVGYKLVKADLPGTMSWRGWVNNVMEEHRPLIQGMVLDAGSGPSGWSKKEFGGQCTLTTFDQFAGENIDVSGDLLQLSSYFPENSFDVVICMETMEHVPQPFVVTEEIRKVLKPGGLFLMTVPFEYGLHGEEYGDYFRYTRQGLKSLLSQFSNIKELTWYGNEASPRQYFVHAVK